MTCRRTLHPVENQKKMILFLIFYVTKKINFGSKFSLLALSTVRFCVNCLIFINSQWSLNDECYCDQQVALSHLSKKKQKQNTLNSCIARAHRFSLVSIHPSTVWYKNTNCNLGLICLLLELDKK